MLAASQDIDPEAAFQQLRARALAAEQALRVAQANLDQAQVIADERNHAADERDRTAGHRD